MSTKTLTIDEAFDLAKSILIRHGQPIGDASTTAMHLVTAERRGYPGHGLRRLHGIVSTLLGSSGTSKNKVTIRKPGFMLLDAQGRLGIPAVTDAAMTAAGRLVRTASILFGVVNYRGTTGSLGVLAASIAEKGVGALLLCNSEFAVAPHGSARAVLGTNPIAIAVPGPDFPFVADISTAAWSYGSIKQARLSGRTLPAGVVQTAAGEPSTDPRWADEGSQLPMAGHKGYALGLAIEILAGPILGAKAGRDAVPGSDGFWGLLFRTDVARDANLVRQDMTKLFDEIRKGPRDRTGDEIRIPGERAQSQSNHTETIGVSESLFAELRDLLKEVR